MSTFGKLIKEARKRLGLKLKDVAELSGLSLITVWAIENEKREPNQTTKGKLCKALKLDYAKTLMETE